MTQFSLNHRRATEILCNSFWVLLGSSVGRLLTFVVSIMLARLSSKDDFGQFMMIRTTVATVESTVSASVGSILVVQAATQRAEGTGSFRNVVAASMLINVTFVILFVLSIMVFKDIFISRALLGRTEIIFAVYIAIPMLLFTLTSSSIQKIAIAIEAYRVLSICSFISVALTLPLVAYLVPKFGWWGALVGIGLYFLIDSIVKWRIIGCRFLEVTRRLVSKIVIRLAFDMLKAGSHLMLAALTTAAFFLLLRIMVANKTGSFEVIGEFDAAYQWLTIILLVTGGTTSVALQMLAKAKRGKSNNEVAGIFGYSLVINFSIALIFGMTMSLFASNIMSLYGSAYVENQQLIHGIGVLAVLMAVSSVFNKLFIVNGDEKLILLIVLASSILVGTIIFLGVMPYSALGLEFAFVIYYLASVVQYAGIVVARRRRYFPRESSGHPGRNIGHQV